MTWKRLGKISSWVNEGGHSETIKVKLDHVVINRSRHSQVNNRLEWFKLNLKKNQKCQFHQNHHIHQIYHNQGYDHDREDLEFDLLIYQMNKMCQINHEYKEDVAMHKRLGHILMKQTTE